MKPVYPFDLTKAKSSSKSVRDLYPKFAEKKNLFLNGNLFMKQVTMFNRFRDDFSKFKKKNSKRLFQSVCARCAHTKILY